MSESDRKGGNVLSFPGRKAPESDHETPGAVPPTESNQDLPEGKGELVSLQSRKKPGKEPKKPANTAPPTDELLERVFAARVAGGADQLREIAREHLEKKIPRRTAKRLKRLLDNTPGLNSTNSYRETWHDAQAWEDEDIRAWIVNREDAWKQKPAFFAALYDIAAQRGLIGII